MTHRTVEELRYRLQTIFGVQPADLSVQRALRVAADNSVKIVEATSDKQLLVVDPYSGAHFVFEASGPLGEYDEKRLVEDITPGEPIPDQFLEGDWKPVDRDWRYLVESNRVGEITDGGGDGGE